MDKQWKMSPLLFLVPLMYKVFMSTSSDACGSPYSLEYWQCRALDLIHKYALCIPLHKCVQLIMTLPMFLLPIHIDWKRTSPLFFLFSIVLKLTVIYSSLWSNAAGLWFTEIKQFCKAYVCMISPTLYVTKWRANLWWARIACLLRFVFIPLFFLGATGSLHVPCILSS